MDQFDIQTLRQTLERASRLFQTPAISLTVIQNGQTIFSEGFGTRTLGRPEPVDGDTSYAIASMSKSTVSMSLAMLHEQNLFRWEDKVTRFLPDFRLYDNFASQEITVIDLLKHNCGLNSESAGTLWYGSDYSREEVIQRLRYLRPVSGFRSAYAYQNVCFLVAGMIIEKISGISWDDFVAENIFKPLEMERSFANLTALQRAGIENIATPHTQIDGKLTAIPYRNHDNVGPAASAHSTTNDLSRYLQLFLEEGAAQGKQLLKPESVAFLQRLHTVYAPTLEKDLLHPRLKSNFTGYGLGWHIQDYQGHKRVGHSGGVDGMRGRMDLFPDDQCAVAVLTNSEDRRAGQSVLYTVYDMLLRLDPVDWVEIWQNDPEKNTAPFSPQQLPGTHASLLLQHYEGIYRDSAYGEIVLSLENEGLVLRFSHTPAFTADLEHWHYDTFRLCWRDPYIPKGLITFSLDSSGAVASFHLDQPRLLDVDFDELDQQIRKIA